MSDDCSDIEPRPSGSQKSRPKTRAHNSRGVAAAEQQQQQKRNRRIVMRIEFDDSDDDDDEDDDEESSSASSDTEQVNDERPSCSTRTRLRGRGGAARSKDPTTAAAAEGEDESDEIRRSSARRLRGRRSNVIYGGDSSSQEGSSSGSEITYRVKRRSAQPSKNLILSEDDQSPIKENAQSSTSAAALNDNAAGDEAGFTSDSSSNELLEKCPICLLTFRQQEIGSPATCEHIFCAACIEAWSKNVQTCPIDRIEFERIIVRESFANRRIVREIKIDSSKNKKELHVDDDDEDVTHCEICNNSDREDVMLLCDSCNQGYHMDCISPPLTSIPEGSWYCDNCFDSQDEDEEGDVEEDLHLLYEDIRDMGIPEASLRVTEVHQPRILRTRQNERIRAAILRHTRSSAARPRTEMTTTTTTSTSTRRGRPRGTSSTTTTTTTTTRTTRARGGSTQSGRVTKKRKRRRRAARRRTYVVEYDLNNFDEKFAIKTTKKIIKRRKRRRRATTRRRAAAESTTGGRLTASQRLAEQLGVKKDPTYTSHLSGAPGGLSLFGGANDLEYFSDSDNGGLEHEIEFETGHGTAVQTSVRISNFGTQRSRKGLLLGRLQRNPHAVPLITTPTGPSSGDLLSSIMDMQDRWHNATRNLENVHINTDGTLKLPQANGGSNDNNAVVQPVTESLPSKDSKGNAQTQSTTPSVNEMVTQAPMYPRGGGNPNFSGGGGGGGGGNYNNNRFNNQGGGYRGGGGGGGGGGGNQYRNSTGGMMSSGNSGGNLQNMVGRGNFNFSNPNYNANNQNSNNFSPFSIRFNPRNQQNQRNNNTNNNSNNNQRNSLPFMNRNEQNNQQQQQQNFNTPPNFNSSQSQSQQQNGPGNSNNNTNSLFSGLPPPMGPQLQSNQNDTNQLFSGLPPPVAMPVGPPPPLAQMSEARGVSGGSNIPPLMSIPPPPAPPVVPLPWNNSLYQLNNDYGNGDDDDSNCPNFSVYSAESQELAKSSELKSSEQDGEAPKEDDENEDLVQLDDDDDIPMPPDNNNTAVEKSDLYEPENPTEENDDDEDEDHDDDDDDAEADNEENKKECTKENVKDSKKSHTDGDAQYDPEQETFSQSNSNSNMDSAKSEQNLDPSNKTSKANNEAEAVTSERPDKDDDDERSPSPALSEIKLPESEASAAIRKGVLELYDDSDWEELDIDKPKGVEKSSKEKSKSHPEAPLESSPVAEAAEPDRSYTPCLDENNEPDEGEGAAASGELLDDSAKSSTSKTADVSKDDDKTSKGAHDSSGIAGMETELISDEDEERDRGVGKGKRRNDKRDKREKENVETFKKVSNKQKERNYRGDKQQQQQSNNKRRDKRPVSRSRSRSRSPRSRSASRSRSRSRFRSRSPRGRAAHKRSNERPFRSRSRSNNKENQAGGTGRQRRRGGANSRKMQQRPRPKRRELPRYDVRNVIGTQQRSIKDRYGRDTSRQRRSRSTSRDKKAARSFSRSRSRSMSPKRTRRCSFSMSPSPAPAALNRRSLSPAPRRFHSPRRRSMSPRRFTPMREQQSRSPLHMRSRSMSPVHRMNGRKVTRHLRGGSPMLRMARSRSPSLSASPHYTPRLYKSRSKSPHLRAKGKKKKIKEHKKKKTKKYASSVSPVAHVRMSRQQDPFEADKPLKKKRRHSPKAKSPIEEPTWSPSPSPPPLMDYDNNNVSWTPPLMSPRIRDEMMDMYAPVTQRSDSKSSKREKRKRNKKKKKGEKRRDTRKEKRRARRTETPEPIPSKEVFASGNNILVSVSFNKDAANQPQPPPQQTTVVTLPPNREDLLTNRRTSVDRMTSGSLTKKKKDKSHKRKKLDAKPVAIIDLERSPFQVHQEPADIIVLTDSEDGQKEHERRRDRRHSESAGEEMDRHRQSMGNNARANSQHDKTPPMERMDTILEESYDMPQTGPKTPPEPPIVKFSIQTKKQNKVRNPLHDDADMNSEPEMPERQDQEPHRQDMDTMHVQSNQKIGPNTPPESGPCSPDVYDPFEPTKSPSLSPRSPTPPPMDVSQTSLNDTTESLTVQKHASDEQRLSGERTVQQMTSNSGNMGSQGPSMNPVDLVMALVSSKPNNSQDMVNKTNDTPFSGTSHMLNAGSGGDEGLNMREKSDEGNSITVLSNVLISSSQQSQHIPVISSPTPMMKSTPIMKLPLPKVGGSVGSSSGIGGPASTATNARNGGADESFNINDIESPYSPGSADYEDLFEPPPDTSNNAKRRQKRQAAQGGTSGKAEVFDNLFGSSSPVGHMRLRKPKSNQPAPQQGNKKSKVKVGRSGDEHIKIYDDVPNSAVELQVKDKFLRKLNRQERVVEEVKLVLKPRFNKKQITKEDYKEIMRRAVPKICHSRSGEINPHKIKNLIEAYVKKFRAKHKKLNIINTGQVSSAVKCAAYLKKL